jgi:hypothetical protein
MKSVSRDGPNSEKIRVPSAGPLYEHINYTILISNPISIAFVLWITFDIFLKKKLQSFTLLTKYIYKSINATIKTGSNDVVVRI